MASENKTLGKSEWYIMEKLWELAPRTYVQLCHELKDDPGWSRSTVQTMLERMTEKGIIRFEVVGRAKQYYPNVTRDDVAVAETRSLLDRAFEGSASMMMSTLVRKKQLTKEEINELYAILQEAEGIKQND
jgi:BlaI family penicillinase repressor